MAFIVEYFIITLNDRRSIQWIKACLGVAHQNPDVQGLDALSTICQLNGIGVYQGGVHHLLDDHLGTSIDLIPTLLSISGADVGDIRERWPDLQGVSLTPALSGQPSERDERGMLLNYTATLAWDVDFVETLFRGQVRGEFTDDEKAQLAAGQSLQGFSCYRGICDGRYKFARYFRPAEHHQPGDWATLIRHNELELYDTPTDPNETDNLAFAPDEHRDLISSLNDRLNELIDQEIGVDDGSWYSSRRSFALSEAVNAPGEG